jgi:FtsH-binding integral membrane protein
MKLNPSALALLLAFCVALLVALSSGSTAFHLAEALATVLIAVGLTGFQFRARRTRRSPPKPL